MRLFAASIATETRPLSPLPTSASTLRECAFLRPGEHPEEPLFGTDSLWVGAPQSGYRGFHACRRKLLRRDARRHDQSPRL